VEQYVCSRISRNPQARIGGARYLGEFTAEKTDYGFTKGAGFYLPAHFPFLPVPQGAAAATGTAAGSRPHILSSPISLWTSVCMSEMCSSRCLSEACLLLGSHCACLSACSGARRQCWCWSMHMQPCRSNAFRPNAFRLSPESRCHLGAWRRHTVADLEVRVGLDAGGCYERRARPVP